MKHLGHPCARLALIYGGCFEMIEVLVDCLCIVEAEALRAAGVARVPFTTGTSVLLAAPMAAVAAHVAPL